jgi:hypothetical protein
VTLIQSQTVIIDLSSVGAGSLTTFTRAALASNVCLPA